MLLCTSMPLEYWYWWRYKRRKIDKNRYLIRLSLSWLLGSEIVATYASTRNPVDPTNGRAHDNATYASARNRVDPIDGQTLDNNFTSQAIFIIATASNNNITSNSNNAELIKYGTSTICCSRSSTSIMMKL
jgi:hypothetical protein